MAGILGDARSDDRAFVAVDGGVLDNIPLGRAITAIAEAPADMPTRRVLVYIRPGGAGGARTESMPDLAALRSTAGVVTGIFRSRVRPETIREDLDLLSGHNRLVLRRRRLRRMVLGGVTKREELRRCAEAGYATYRLQRAEYDAQVVRRLLEDRVTVVGEDPFPRVEDIDDRQWRAPLSYQDPHDVATFDAGLADEFAQRLTDDPASAIREGVRPITRLTRLLLDWARYLEREDHPEAGKVKGRLYEALLIQTELAERIRRLALVTIATCHPDRLASDALGTVDELLALSQDDVSAVLERCNGEGTASLDSLRTRLRRALGVRGIGAGPRLRRQSRAGLCPRSSRGGRQFARPPPPIEPELDPWVARYRRHTCRPRIGSRVMMDGLRTLSTTISGRSFRPGRRRRRRWAARQALSARRRTTMPACNCGRCCERKRGLA